jgi:hypothetical protein
MKVLNNARLRLEIAWCRLCDDSYPVQLDLALLAHTALVLVSALPQRTADEVRGVDGGLCARGPPRDRRGGSRPGIAKSGRLTRGQGPLVQVKLAIPSLHTSPS